MAARLSGRRRALERPLTGLLVRQAARALFPRRNDYIEAPERYEALVGELARHGVRTRGQLRRLLQKHRHALLALERFQLQPAQVRRHVALHADANVRDAVRRQYWFGYPSFVRQALAREFGTPA
jgi:hypothetical protein